MKIDIDPITGTSISEEDMQYFSRKMVEDRLKENLAKLRERVKDAPPVDIKEWLRNQPGVEAKRERWRENSRRLRNSNPEYRKRQNEVTRKWRESNIETIREYDRERGKKWRESHRELARERSRTRYAENIDKERERGRLRRASNPDKARAQFRKSHYRRMYNITPEERQVMIERQSFLCAMCSSPLDMEHPRRVHTDHNHTTGRVRGILCERCNYALGIIENDELLSAGIAYLDRYKE